MYKGVPVLDLDYLEDSSAETDLNVVMTDAGGFIEVQGTAEGELLQPEQLNDMLRWRARACRKSFRSSARRCWAEVSGGRSDG